MKAFKAVAKPLVFLVILFWVCLKLYGVMSWKDAQGIDNLYKNKPGTADVLFVGSSRSYCTVNTALLWKKSGIAALDISDGQQPFTVSYTYLKEALKTQHPSVVFIELMGMNLRLSVESGLIYRDTINMKWSANYIENMDNALKNLGEERAMNEGVAMKDLRRAILLKYPVIHTRYRELTKSDFEKNRVHLRYASNWSRKEYPVPEDRNVTEISELTEEELEILNNLKTLSEENGFKLVLWVAPFYIRKEAAMRFNAVEQFCARNNIAYYNFVKLLDETGFDFSRDMRNENHYGSHINNFGAKKITEFLCKVLNEEYHLPDHRGDPLYSDYALAAREWDVINTKYKMASADTLEEFAEAADQSLFNITVIDFGKNETDDLSVPDLFGVLPSRVRGLYTSAVQNRINKSWELSDHVKLTFNNDDISKAALYNDSSIVKVEDCDICTIVVDKDNGELVYTGIFKLDEEEYKQS